MVVSSGGPADAANPVATDTLPPGLAFVDATGAGWTCAVVAGVVMCDRATLAAGATSTITLRLAVPVAYAGPATT